MNRVYYLIYIFFCRHYLIDINIKIYYISMLISFKFNYISYKIKKVFVWINKIYLCVRINLIIYIIVTEFLTI